MKDDDNIMIVVNHRVSSILYPYSHLNHLFIHKMFSDAFKKSKNQLWRIFKQGITQKWFTSLNVIIYFDNFEFSMINVKVDRLNEFITLQPFYEKRQQDRL